MNMNTVFSKIKKESLDRIEKLREAIGQMEFPEPPFDNICIFACGSLGRLEMTEQSDLDLFFISDFDSNSNDRKQLAPNLDKYRFFAQLYEINHQLNYKDPSRRGEYWVFTSKDNMLDIGSREEDYNNSFTARMLLLLESKPLYNFLAYDKLVEDTVGKYFVDYKDHDNEFYPLYLMNDILRYWYTLTLNYEYRRDDKDDQNKKYWRRLKLKYARLITCYSMLASLYQKNITSNDVIRIVKMTPFERLEAVAKGDEELQEIVSRIFSEYEWYLNLRKQGPEWWNDPEHKKEAFSRADKFHHIVFQEFMKKVSEKNPALRNKVDIY